MTTDKDKELKSVHIRLSDKLLKDIDKFTSEFYFTSRTDAMRFLLGSGLKYQKIASDLISRNDDATQKDDG